MIMKKLVIASVIAMIGVSAAQAQAVSSPTESTTAQETGLVTSLTSALSDLFTSNRLTTVTGSGVDAVTTYSLPVDITAIAGAVNMSTINGSIDISGTNVSITGIAGDVSAKAESIANTTSTATSFAINGNNFSTTVIGAMNSSTLDVMAKTSNLTNSASSGLDVASLASQGGQIALATPSVTGQTTSIGNTIASINVLSGTSLAAINLGLDGLVGGVGENADTTTFSNLQQDLAGLSANTMSDVTSDVKELQSMNVFNMALNVAPIVAGVKIAALADTNAWFLNPQTGLVNVSNLQIATTAIGAMNSSITHLGANLTTLAK